ncbi:MAG: hypothetical protein OEV27_16860 [Nitrospira sp.]|nr:hypothetical protein [Nitrospira sp.]MDH4252849.1 hypothetical protein [Nitrospira sp.]MDH4342506.1 hypothetical protein [Nitrospira sp.]MDH5335679.1 hypothetical protein [Nitrospira sp.]
MSFDSLLGPLIGASAALTGVGLNEFIRRRNRAESFAQAIFSRRLEAFEALFHAMGNARRVFSASLGAPPSKRKEAKDAIMHAGLAIAELSDRLSLYIEEVGLHCTALWLDPPDILDIQDSTEREAAISEFQREYQRALQMIRDLSGLSSVERVFTSVSGAQVDSAVVARIRELQRELQNP